MADKKHEQSGFKETDRRLSTSAGVSRAQAPEEGEPPKASTPIATKEAVSAEKPPAPVAVDAEAVADREMPMPPTSAEQEAQAAAYRQSSKDVDTQGDRKSV